MRRSSGVGELLPAAPWWAPAVESPEQCRGAGAGGAAGRAAGGGLPPAGGAGRFGRPPGPDRGRAAGGALAASRRAGCPRGRSAARPAVAGAVGPGEPPVLRHHVGAAAGGTGHLSTAGRSAASPDGPSQLGAPNGRTKVRCAWSHRAKHMRRMSEHRPQGGITCCPNGSHRARFDDPAHYFPGLTGVPAVALSHAVSTSRETQIAGTGRFRGAGPWTWPR